MTMRARPSLVLLALVVAAVGLAACGSSADNVQSAPPTTPDQSGPAGRTYVSTGVAGRTLVAGTTVTLTFDDDGNLSVQAGCNTLGATYTIEDGKLGTGNFGGTEMGCDQPRHDQDQWISTFLSSRPTVVTEGDKLVLASGDTTLTLRDREVVQPDKPLEGTTWVVDTIIDGDAASSVPAEPKLYLVFGDGEVKGSDGCNGVRASAEIATDTITFGPAAMTDMACGTVQEEFRRVIGPGKVTFEADGDRLTLTAPSGKALGLRAE